MNRRVTEMAEELDLEFNLDKAVVANSFDAHRFAHYAKQQGKGNECEELLFKAYFTEGRNIDDIDVLVSLGESLNLDPNDVGSVLQSDQFAEAVRSDIQAAQAIGVQGVPFFVFNRKYAVSGAQPVDTFLNALQKSWSEWNSRPRPNPINSEGNSAACGPNNNC